MTSRLVFTIDPTLFDDVLKSFHCCVSTGKPRVELTYDKMYTVTSRLTFTVSREDDGVPVICIVDHPAVKDFQAQRYLEVQCEYGCSVLQLHYAGFYSLFRVSHQLLRKKCGNHLQEHEMRKEHFSISSN